MNRLFVAYKPPFISSNTFLSKLKKRYRVKKGGFSGTLDPFASGTLVIAFGAYTKLFRFLKTKPKSYRTTLWLGAKSPTLDIERVEKIEDIPKLPLKQIQKTIKNFEGPFTYTPPLFSAKRVKGRRAYELAHKGQKVDLKPITSQIYDIKLLHYRHPFITFEARVSEGTYIRSLGEAIAKALGYEGSLSYLERLNEGNFTFENERALDPIKYLSTQENRTTLSKEAILKGKKIKKEELAIQKEGKYHLLFDDFFTIIEVTAEGVKYLLNAIPRMQNGD